MRFLPSVCYFDAEAPVPVDRANESVASYSPPS